MPKTIRPPVQLDRHAELISRSIAHIDAHLDGALDALTLADRAAMSRHHFHRMFKAYVGCSVGTYVTWRRLQRACALLVSGTEPVLDIALSVGYESAQALSKAMRRELDTTPTAVRRGDHGPWHELLAPGRGLYPPSPSTGVAAMLQVTRYADLPPHITALTATARGMVANTMSRAAQTAFREVVSAAMASGQLGQVASFMCIVPDDANGPDDPHCRFVAGLVFGYNMASGQGRCTQPEIPLQGTLAWQTLEAGRYAVFTHKGPYSTLHETWRTIYHDWLPASGMSLRDVPPMELCLNNPETTPPEALLTEVWIPIGSPA